jgi:hypothetical protein
LASIFRRIVDWPRGIRTIPIPGTRIRLVIDWWAGDRRYLRLGYLLVSRVGLDVIGGPSYSWVEWSAIRFRVFLRRPLDFRPGGA